MSHWRCSGSRTRRAALGKNLAMPVAERKSWNVNQGIPRLPYEDTTTCGAEKKFCESGKDNDCSRAVIIRGPGLGIAGSLLGADFGHSRDAVNLGRGADCFLAAAGWNGLGFRSGRAAVDLLRNKYCRFWRRYIGHGPALRRPAAG